MASPEYMEMLERWGKAWERKEPDYMFEEDNKYASESNPYELALSFIRQGMSIEAVLCLEAEVSRSPENSEAWALLGKLHQQNDEDERAIAAMQKGLSIDPYNLELLMSLGISCTNEYDSEKALNYLKL